MTVVNETAEILTDALSVVKKTPDETFIRRFQQSLPRFLNCHEQLLVSPKHAAGTARWLAYCTAEALEREPIRKAERDRFLAEWCLFHLAYADSLERRARHAGLMAEHGEEKMLRVFTAWRGVITTWTWKLQEDLLFPGLRGPITQEVHHETMKRLDRMIGIGAWDIRGNSLSMEALDQHFRNAAGNVLLDLLIHELRPRVDLNRYWGYTMMRGTNGKGSWPALLYLDPAEGLNQSQGWKREDGAPADAPDEQAP